VDAVDHQGRTALHVDQKSIDCVEREAAGAMNDFPCLAIRGHLCLCRFTQDYGMVAAAIATTYAQGFLLVVHIDQVLSDPIAGDSQSTSLYNG
jgi:hypothetical protein